MQAAVIVEMRRLGIKKEHVQIIQIVIRPILMNN